MRSVACSQSSLAGAHEETPHQEGWKSRNSYQRPEADGQQVNNHSAVETHEGAEYCGEAAAA